MTRRIALILSLLALTAVGIGQSPAPLPAETDAPAAVLTSCRGSVVVTRAGGQAAVATFGLALNDGDEVRTGADAEAALLEEVVRGVYRLEAFNGSDVADALRVIQKYSDLELGLADASIVVLAEKYGVRDVLTLDERHFRALRTSDRKPFRLLPADK